MKKVVSFVLAITIVLSLCGCASEEKDKHDKPANAGVTTASDSEPNEADSEQTEVTDADLDKTVADEAASDETDIDDSEQPQPEETTSEVTTAAETVTEPVTTTVVSTEPPVTTQLSVTDPVPTEPEFVVEPMSAKMYATATANVRSGPATSYNRLGHVDEGDAVEVTGVCENGWYRIKFKGGEGFVGGSYIVKDKPIVTTAATTVAVTTAITKASTEISEKKEEPSASKTSFEIAKELMGSIKTEEKCPDKYIGSKSGVTYGKTEKKTYYSKTCEKNRPVNIVLPANYSKDKKYPVLYVLHGIFGNEGTMINDNDPNIRTLMGNLTANGLAEEMIVVYPYMYASKTQDVCTAIDVENSAAYDNFLNDLVNDLMPFMAKNYSVAEGKENTAVFGFSMGGREALAIGFAYPDKFGYIGAACPAPGLVPGRDWAMEHPGQFKESELKFNDEMPYLIMIGAGDKDGTVGSFPQSYHDLMAKNKVEHIYYVIKGSDHGNPAIQSVCYNFVTNIFKN